MHLLAQGGEAFGLGVLVSAFLFGFRHGIDWDHIAAITDITSSQENRRASVVFGTLYALGHALVVFVIGSAAILLGAKLPESVDPIMERIVGFTLVILGVFVFASLIKHGREFRMRSRWMLIFSGVRTAYRKTRGVMTRSNGDAAGHAHDDADPIHQHATMGWPSRSPTTSRSRSGTTVTTADPVIITTSTRSPMPSWSTGGGPPSSSGWCTGSGPRRRPRSSSS